LLLLLSPTLCPASPIDYAYQARLGEVEIEVENATLQRVPLGLDVILNLTRTDLGDIAVFNADGKQLLHSVTRVQPATRKLSQPLAFHEFSRFQRQQAKTVTTREQTRQQDSLTELVTTETVAQQQQRKDYLVELEPQPKQTARLVRIELQWTHAPADQILVIRVEAGNALDDLRMIQASKSLTNIDSADPGWRSIDGIPPGYRYLRLTAVNDVDRFELQGAIAHYDLAAPAAVLQYRLPTTLTSTDDALFYQIDYPSKVHAESLRIVPATPDSVISGRLYASWGDSAERRQLRASFQQHNIIGGDIRDSNPIVLPKRQYHSIAFTSTGALTAPPSIEVLYPQYELLFLGDGNGPYTLAWGNYASTGPVSDLATLLDEGLLQAQLKAIPVSLGSTEEAGGLARLEPATELPWKKWLLWTLLLLAVIVTARMAFKLYREMNATSST
jgi:hypothetical protein